ncbi:hypothetical protein DFH09DRAFT_1457139 [Mycena vulgaris]|nr:hypothetical protein DFH09DRAFT_1457139 [Mycena vulgaris]
MSPTIYTTAPLSTTQTTSTTSWKTLSVEISGFFGHNAKSASSRKHSSLPSTGVQAAVRPAAPPRRTSLCTRRPALKPRSSAPSPTPSEDSVSSCLSSTAPSPATEAKFKIPFAPLTLVEDDDELIDGAQSTPPTVKSNHCQLLLHQIRQIHFWAPSSRPRRTSRVFPDLMPPPEWDEVSLTIESDDDLEIFPAAGLERKVRFVVPAPPPQVVEADWEEPAWSDFMGIQMDNVIFVVPVVQGIAAHI